MLDILRNDIRHCCERAAWNAEQALHTVDACERHEYDLAAESWRQLARKYENTAQLWLLTIARA